MKENDIKYLMKRYGTDFNKAFAMSEYIIDIMKNENVKIEKACDIFDENGSSKLSNEKISKKNFYQIIAIIFMVLAFISSVIIGSSEESEASSSIAFVVLIGGFVSCIFMYGFGEIIKQLKMLNIKIGKFK